MKKKHLCTLCPRNCNAERTTASGYCSVSNEIMAARAALHFWEEPCISGKTGSGTVFFSGCSLRCVYCQNREIALGNIGKVISIKRLAEIFLELQEKGACNINLVTPTHYILQIKEALILAKQNGLSIPIVYNTSSYETVESLHLLEGLIDIYLPDLKYKSPQIAKRYSNAPNYFSYACAALKEMYRQVGSPIFENDLLKRGIIVRHLVLPCNTNDSKEIIYYLYHTYRNNIYISIMNQYTPVIKQTEFLELNRKLTKKEYDEVVDYAIELGVEYGFIQEEETAKESFIPMFDYEGIEK